MSGSVFKWGAGWRKGILLLRSKLSIRWWEHCMLYVFFLSALLLFSPFAILLNCFHPSLWVLPFFLLILLPIPLGREQEWKSNCMALCCQLRLSHNSFWCPVWGSYCTCCCLGPYLNRIVLGCSLGPCLSYSPLRVLSCASIGAGQAPGLC